MILCALFWKWGIWRADPELSFLSCYSPFHRVRRSHQKWQQCLFSEISFPMFTCIASAAMNGWPFSRYLIITVSSPHIVPDQRTNTKFYSERYSYRPMVRCDLHCTDELIAGTLTLHQVLYGQNLLHARECSSLVYQESLTRISHWK